MSHRTTRKSALALMMVAGGLVAAAPALTTPAFAQSTKAAVGPCAKTRKGAVGPCMKTRKGVVAPCMKTRKGLVAPCAKTKKGS